ncbi:ATP-dependent RecD-like DNA helicase [Rhodanobacter sp. 115]|uniref:SF1B family DNA helicase RecD2 n=1 Tax=Rhodanobacter sp. FW021-MT20 TaxID=1162282 RepID=UPI0034E3F0AC
MDTLTSPPEATVAPTGAPVSFTGTILAISYRNEETGYTIMRVQPADLTMGASVAVVGLTLADLGDEVNVVGAWNNHPKFGSQVKADTITAVRPSTPETIEKYLASGVLPGVGAGLAKRIVKVFGAETLDVLDADPERLLEVQGIGERKIDAIAEAWKEQKSAQDIMVFLAGQDISPAMAIRIFKRYGPMAPEVIRQNPYRLATDVRGIGFLMADKIAASLGIPKNSPQRIEAGLRYVVQQATGRGHCGITHADALKAAGVVLGQPEHLIGETLDNLLAAGDQELTSKAIASGVPCVFSRKLFVAENEIAKRVAALAKLAGPWPDASEADLDALVARAEERAGMTLASAQRAAVRLALTRRVSILTGGPGTGKTSTLGAILASLLERRLRIKLAAPTGKAAKRMREATGYDAQTVARLIGMGAGEPQPIECDVLVIDEASMIDVPMMDAVLTQLDPNASLLLVGDVDQLPSVGPGRVLADLIESGAVPVTRLTEIFRQAAQSAIIRNSHRINRGQGIEDAPPPDAPAPDFYFIACDSPAEVSRRIVRLVTQSIPERRGIAAGDVQVLSPMRRTETGTDALNLALRAALNPHPVDEIKRGTFTFGVGDKVLQTVNNYELGVMNGESGTIASIDHEARTMRVSVDGKDVDYPVADLDQLTLAYAMTIHKAQGSQFPAVVIPVTTQHYMMLLRSILYTGVTRATKFCVIVGQRRALDMAIRNDRLEPRLTRLEPLLAPLPGRVLTGEVA